MCVFVLIQMFFLNFQECEKETYLCYLVLQWDYQMTPVFSLLI